MRDKRVFLLGVVLSGVVGLNAPLYSQGMPDDKEQAGSQTESIGVQAASDMSEKEVRRLQQALKDEGHDPGPIDGKLGTRTEAALKAFQKANGLTATGRLDGETEDKLGLENVTDPAAAESSGSGESPKIQTW